MIDDPILRAINQYLAANETETSKISIKDRARALGMLVANAAHDVDAARRLALLRERFPALDKLLAARAG